ncbi:hypothetical protein PAXINDRAFT_15300 [Paxillus involutus ATCC 200175]|uniref:Uncharacterized protein n=1 Tax=Paxillus involutus ATCC 200175 TaxID=664439 RepID=A0A0C9TVS6_PAXIN|nr:hypothetical protein PAXINDRAFT_15300 [Paxillus involutus ATCC 200175]
MDLKESSPLCVWMAVEAKGKHQQAITATITPVGPSPPTGRHLQREMAMITVDGQSPSPSWPTSFLLCAHPSPIVHHRSATLLPTNPLLLGQPITNWPPSMGHPIVYKASFPGLPHIPSLPFLGQPITHTWSHISHRIMHEHSSAGPPISPSTARHHRHQLNGPSPSKDHHHRHHNGPSPLTDYQTPSPSKDHHHRHR